MSGWELAREIRLINQQVPIAVITGWGEAVGSHEQKAAGVDWVVAKPFTADRIAELVRDISRLGSKRQTVAARACLEVSICVICGSKPKLHFYQSRA